MGLRDNKLLRAKLQVKAKNKYAVGENQPTPDEQLTRLEDDIRRLRVEFDIFFNGATKRPPLEARARLESFIKRIADNRNLTYAQRYHFNTLVARFTAYRELWRRNLKARGDELV